MGKPILWSALLALPPSILIYLNYGDEKVFAFLSLALFLFLFPLILLISAWPAFSPNAKLHIWLVSVAASITLISAYEWFTITFLGGQGTIGPLVAITMLILLAPVSLFVFHAMISGYVLRRLAFHQDKQALWKGVAIAMFFVPFVLWYGVLPVATFLMNGLIHLSDLL